MHDTIIGRLINKIEFNRDIHAKIQVRPTTGYLAKVIAGVSFKDGIEVKTEDQKAA